MGLNLTRSRPRANREHTVGHSIVGGASSQRDSASVFNTARSIVWTIILLTRTSERCQSLKGAPRQDRVSMMLEVAQQSRSGLRSATGKDSSLPRWAGCSARPLTLRRGPLLKQLRPIARPHDMAGQQLISAPRAPLGIAAAAVLFAVVKASNVNTAVWTLIVAKFSHERQAVYSLAVREGHLRLRAAQRARH